MIIIVIWTVVQMCASAVDPDHWRWPEDQPRLDGKVRFLDLDDVLAKSPKLQRLKSSAGAGPDSIIQCKCVLESECFDPRSDTGDTICPSGKSLCCFKRDENQRNEYFSEARDPRHPTFPGQSVQISPFPPPPNTAFDMDFLPGHSQAAGNYGTIDGKKPEQMGVLVGPEGPTGYVGPMITNNLNSDKKTNFVSYSPDGKTQGVLIGPEGETGKIGPNIVPYKTNFLHHGIGDENHVQVVEQVNELGSDASAQRGILVGPGGATGVIGPYRRPVYTGTGGRNKQRPILFGPGGPTGIIGPTNKHTSGGVLVGPGGPTGFIGPNRRSILYGPGGPTGQIGPRKNYYYQ